MKDTHPLILLLVCILPFVGCGRSPRQYVEQGNRFYAAGKYEEASLQYRRALQRDENSGEAHYGLALTQLRAQQGTEALRSLQRAMELMPADEKVATTLADVSLAAYLKDPLQSQSLYDTIAKVADRLIAKDSNSFHGLRLKGALAMIDRKPSEAIAFYRRADQRQPMNPDVVIGLVQALLQEGQPEEAEKLALALIAKDKTFGAIYNVLYDYYLASRQPAKAEAILATKIVNMPTEASAVIQLAGHYASMQKLAEMVSTLETLTDPNRSYALGRLAAGDFYRDLGRAQDAMRLYEAGAKSDPRNKHTYQRRIAGMLSEQGNRQEAGALLEKILKENPNDTETRVARAALAAQEGRLDSAISELESLLKENPQNAELQLRLGQALYRRGDLERARRAVGASLALQGDSIGARIALCEITLAQQQPAQALRVAEDTLRLFPGQPRIRLLRAASLIALERLDEARSELTRLGQLFPNDPELRLQAGLIALQERKFGDAEALFRSLQSPNLVDVRATLGLVETYARQNRLDKVIEVLSAEIQKAPEATVLRGLLADAAIKTGQRNLAQAQYEAMLAKTPDSPDLLVRLGDFYREAGDIQNAVRTLERAKRAAPNSPMPLVALALTMERADKPAEAQTYYRQVLKIDPNQPVALNNLAYLLAESGGDLEEALSLVQRALQRMPNEPGLMDTQAWIYLKKKMPDAALRTLSVLARKHPEVPTIHYHLGVALLQKGDRQRAKASLEAALGKNPSPAEERKIRDLISGLGS